MRQPHRVLSAPAFLGTFVLAVCCLRSDVGTAEGAVALGLPGDVAKLGYALGIAVNAHTEAAAKAAAMRLCQNDESASRQGKAVCKVMQTFHRQCAAEANDPKAGTPGWGWAIAPDLATAEKNAIANCVATAGSDRRDACKVLRSACDTGP